MRFVLRSQHLVRKPRTDEMLTFIRRWQGRGSGRANARQIEVLVMEPKRFLTGLARIKDVCWLFTMQRKSKELVKRAY